MDKLNSDQVPELIREARDGDPFHEGARAASTLGEFMMFIRFSNPNLAAEAEDAIRVHRVRMNAGPPRND